MDHLVRADVGRRTGIELSVLRKWANAPRKGKTAATLCRFGALSREEYDLLEDGRTIFWNNPEMISIFLATGLDINGIAASVGRSVVTITTYIKGKDSQSKTAALIQQLKHNMGV